jgi:alcohol dehydrogenase YqhD (iron-dependent ADH family)
MKSFEFFNPTKLIFGRGTINRIGQEINRYGYRKVLLIAGSGSIRKNGVYDRVVNSLKNAGIEWIEVWGVRSNPVLTKVRTMIALVKKSECEAILSVGGGSVIDSGKAVAAGFYMEDIWEAFENHTLIIKALPNFTILTISATGSEMNMAAVLTNEAKKKKWVILGPALYPKVSILDPLVQDSLPWEQTVNGAIDALSHIMEYYFIGGQSETTLALNESLSRTIIQMTDRLKENPKDYESRANLAWAATLAFNGVSGAGLGFGDWASHGIEHSLSGLNPDVSHGAGLGVIFPAWIRYCHKENPSIFERWAKNIWGVNDINSGIAAMQSKIKSWGGRTTLRELGIDDTQIDEITAKTIESGFTGVVKELGDTDIKGIITSAL